ncbi:MAG: SDR family oxidoreductase [Gemmataceae bacterium]|nr:SDR family oxidoreductase [Gemmataceae bacterium]MCI0740323.1 SDR family oxidoreductase [Gemmataceae bacterium]
MSLLTNKVALVTGGGSGIGLAVVKSFLENGAKVVAAGRNLAKLQSETAALGPKDRLHLQAADVSDKAQVSTLVKSATQRFGPIDILVNNAGANIKNRTFRELTPEVWDQLIRINLDGAFYCIHAVFPSMAERKTGVIVNISSIAGKRASPLGGIAYAASKFGMSALGMGLGAEEKDSGIRVTNIYPGEVDTPILEHRPTPVTEDHRQRILKPEDVAAAVLFVCAQPPRVHIPELIIKPVSQVYI